MLLDKINIKDIVNNGIEHEIKATKERQEKINKIKKSIEEGDLKDIVKTPEILSYLDINKYYNKKADEKTEFLEKQQENFNKTYNNISKEDKESYINKILSDEIDTDVDDITKFVSKLTAEEKEALQKVIDSRKELYTAKADLIKTLINKTEPEDNEEEKVEINIEEKEDK